MTDIPSNEQRIQVESTQTRAPASESLMQSVGGTINWILDYMYPVGGYLWADLDQTQLDSQWGSGRFLLANGQSCAGSRYETLTGNSTVPLVSGRYLRSKDNGSGNDTHGDLPLGTTYADQFGSHNHQIRVQATVSAGPQSVGGIANTSPGPGVGGNLFNTTSSGGAETNPRTLVANVFIRVN